MTDGSSFYIAALEQGAEQSDLPVWASKIENPFGLSANVSSHVERVEVPSVLGAFQLLNLLQKDEAQSIIEAAEKLGFTEDAAVSLPRSVRHNDNLNWISDDFTTDLVWKRAQEFFTDKYKHFAGKAPLGINGRFRFYRYSEGDFFKMHIDGSWPGSKIVDNAVVADAYGDRWSMYTFLILLNEDFKGGETQFMVRSDDPSKPARSTENSEIISVRTPAGGALCFPHGTHPYHCMHGSAVITEGVKYIIRTDVLFEL